MITKQLTRPLDPLEPFEAAYDVAEALREHIEEHGCLTLDDALDFVRREAPAFLTEGEAGKPALDEGIRALLRSMGPPLVYERGRRLWRHRRDGDGPYGIVP